MPAQRFLPALSATLALIVGLLPTAAARSSAPAVTIHVTVSGAYHFSHVYSHAIAGPNYGCTVSPNLNMTGKQYSVSVDPTAVDILDPTHDGFSLTVDQYRPSVRRYVQTTGDRIFVGGIIKHRFDFTSTGMYHPYRVTVTIAPDGRSGSASVVGGGAGHTARPYKRGSVAIRATWHCDTLLHQG